MKKNLLSMIAGTLLLLLLLPASAQAQGLTFSISLNKPVYTVGEPIECTMTLKNTGTTPLVVNNRFAVNRPMGMHEVSFQIIDPSLKSVFFSTLINSKFDSNEYTTLPPGATIAATYVLTDDFTLSTLGKHTVTGFYENQTDPPPSLGLPTAWKGRLKSNKVSFILN